MIGDVDCILNVGSLEHQDRYYRHLVRVDEDGTLTELAREESHRVGCYDFCACMM